MPVSGQSAIDGGSAQTEDRCNDRPGNPPGRAHLVGIAGAGMAALAEVLRGRGWVVGGSDRTLADHAAANVGPETDLLVYSAAVASDNPEVVEARRRKIPCFSYPEALAWATRGERLLAVAGAHGKSTTVAMTGAILAAAGIDPTVMGGAAIVGRDCGGRAGRRTAAVQTTIAPCAAVEPEVDHQPMRRGVAVVEACEYRGHFLHLRPAAAVLTGIEGDHFDYYPTDESLVRAYRSFSARIDPDGLLLVGADCRTARQIAAEAHCRTETFGLTAEADWSVEGLDIAGGASQFTLLRRGQPLAEVRLPLPGRHNVLNAVAAAALAWEGGARAAAIAAALAGFPGVRRRLETRGTHGGVLLIDDYAHHPTEVAAALGAIRQWQPGRRLWCVFQPHQASRTVRLFDRFAAALTLADRVCVADIFHARETPHDWPEVSAARLAGRIAEFSMARRATLHADLAAAAATLENAAALAGLEDPANAGVAAAAGTDTIVYAEHHGEDILRRLAGELTAGDVLVTMGAGDIHRLAQAIIDELDGRPREIQNPRHDRGHDPQGDRPKFERKGTCTSV